MGAKLKAVRTELILLGLTAVFLGGLLTVSYRDRMYGHPVSAPKEGCRTRILPYYAVNVYNRPDGYSRTTRTETTGSLLCVFL